MKRVFNFGAGPAALPASVLEEASRGVLEFADTGMSILEVSHRSKAYEAMHKATRETLLRVLKLDSKETTVLFLGGGASLQFLMLPMNFLSEGETADYVHTGEWSRRAIEEAQRFGDVALAGSSEADDFASIPKALRWTPGARYAHITTNNTIEGTQWSTLPEVGTVPLVADVSSDLMARESDYRRFSLCYAGAQKNAGPAGVTLVIARNEFLATANEDLPTMMAYETHRKSDSLYHTPPVFGVYVVGLVLKWVEAEGGLAAIGARNLRKAKAVYDALDRYPDVYETVVKRPEDRSLMNLTFRLRKNDQEKEFLQGAIANHLDGLKGHRSVGGFRASLYNAVSEEAAQALANYLETFARR